MPWRCPLTQRGAAERSTYEHNSDLWCWVGPTAFKVKPVIFDLRILDTQSLISLKSSFYIYNSSPYREKEGEDITKVVWK